MNNQEQPRLPLVDPAHDDSLTEVLAKTPRLRGRPLNLMLVLAHHPSLLRRWTAMGTVLLTGALPGRECEIVVLRTGWRCHSVYEFAQHRRRGLEFGLDEDDLRDLTMESPSEKRWTDDDLVLIAMVDELCASNDLSDETWHRLQTRWHPDALIQLLTLTGYYRMVSGVLNALRVPLDDGLAGWP